MKFRLWPGIVFVLLGLNACVVAATVYLAKSDRSFAVEPDYYRKGLAWNQTAAQMARNRALGWTTQVQVGAVGALGRHVTVFLRDRDGQPLDGASISVVAFHDARAGQPVDGTCQADDRGGYATSLPIDRAGWWEFRFHVSRASETFTCNTRVLVPASGAIP